jgi:hypothetical protein
MTKEVIAVILAVLVIASVAYFQIFHHSTKALEQRAPERPAISDHGSRLISAAEFSAPSRPQAHTLRAISQPARPKRATAQSAARTSSYQGTGFRQEAGDYPFYVAQKKWNPQRKEYDFIRRGMHGSEVPMRTDARRYFLSENQNDYPEPASGCGPTALLNLYIWYTKFGLLTESITHSNPQTYKQLKFRQIDRKLLDIQRESRTRRGGTNTLAGIVAMDELVQEYSRNRTRLHFEIQQPPLDRQDFINLSRGYRVGILSVRPKDRQTGRLRGNHAVLCIRGDTAGMVTIANWGEFSHGSLVQRPDGQWFVPNVAEQPELRINHLTTLIPFTPAPET